MANKEESEEQHLPPRGNEWEVVSLTSSAYAASPGPYNVESREAKKYDAFYGAETSRDLYMSDHFVFPPSEHENLPIDEEAVSEEEHEEESKDGEESFYGESVIGSSRNLEPLGSESPLYEHGLVNSEPSEYEESGLRTPLGLEKDAKKSTHDNLPCEEAWWRKRAVSMYSRTREANAIWSLFFAAAVTGLVVLGQRWQQERWQVLQLKWQSSINSEKLSRVLEPLSRLKDVVVRGNPQASLIRSGSSSET